MITLWDKVKIGETDDISKLLAGREYSTSGIMLIDRGAELERCTGKATDRSASQEEETGNKGIKDHKHAYEGSGGSNRQRRADGQGIDFSKDYER